MQKGVGVPSDQLLSSLKERTYAPRTNKRPHSWYTSAKSANTERPNPELAQRELHHEAS